MIRPAHRVPESEAGFTLIEVMVSLSLLGLTLIVMAPVTMRMARLSTVSTVSTQRTAVLAGEAQRLDQVDFDDLAPGTTCSSYMGADFPHSRCIRVTSLNSTTRRLTIIVTPANATADSVTFDRTRGSRYNPLSQ